MERAPVSQPRIRNLGFKVGLLLTLIPFIAIGLVLYALYARGVFESSQKLVLIARDAEGVTVGMPIMFSGFPIGQVSSMALTESGEVQIKAWILEKDARWLRTSSVFTLERQFFGGAKIRVTTNNMNDPQLPPGATGKLVGIDAAQDLPQVIARASAVLQNIEEMIKPDSSLNRSLAHLNEVTGRMAGEYGVLGSLAGSPENAGQVMETVKGVSALIASLKGVTSHADSMLTKADEKVFAQGGVMDEARKSVVHLNAILGDARESLKKADTILANVQAVTDDGKATAANIKGATTDLAALRTEVDDSIRKLGVLIDEINRKWPFARKTEIKLP
jgi:phospholipid/cholesterol/gamma-HCH transport system substrate-binding protein